MTACPAFSADGPAGIAEALRSVDCMSAHATGAAFARLFGADAMLGPVLTACLTLYVALFAIQLLSGRSAIGLSMLTPRMMGLGLVLTFTTSWIAYQSVIWNLLVGAPDQIASLLAGTRGSATMLFAEQLDRLFGVIADAAQGAQDAAGAATAAPPAQGFTPADLLWLAALMLLLGTVGVLIVARIALAALLAVGPLFILLGLFRGSRGLFEGWLKTAVLFALTPLFAVLLGSGGLAMLSPVVNTLSLAGGDIPLRVAVTVFLGAAVYCALMLIVMKVTTALTLGWRLPSFGADAPSRPGDGASWRNAAPAPSPATSFAQGARNASSPDHVRALVSGIAAMPSPSAPAPADYGERVRVLMAAPPLSSAPSPAISAATPDERTRGVGARFRSAPPALLSCKESNP